MFLRLLKGGADIEELAQKFPVLYEVHYIYEEAKTTRWLLEGFIMSGISAEEIADQFGWETTEIVETYELCKFDVRGRLKTAAFVLSHVLGGGGDCTQVISDDRIYKMLGWIGYKKGLGPVILDGYINLDVMDAETQDFYHDMITNQLTRKTVRALLKFDTAKSKGIMELVDAYQSNQKLLMEKKERGLSSANSEQDRDTKTLVETLGLIPASLEQRNTPIQLEPRADEAVVAEINQQLLEEAKQKKELPEAEN